MLGMFGSYCSDVILAAVTCSAVRCDAAGT